MDAVARRAQGEGMELIELYRRTVSTWTARVEAVAPDAWDAATPCVEWTVRDLVNHVTGEDAWTVPLLRGSSVAEVGGSFDGDLLGDEPAAAAVRGAEEAVAVVDERLPTGGQVHLSYGDEDMGEYVRQLAADHLVHAWDLAAATGGDRALDEDLVDAVGSWFADREELYRSGGVVGPRMDTAGDAPSAQTTLLAGFGRDARWTPPQH
jgi:uncharacterized protein (TIGR03086 family)